MWSIFIAVVAVNGAQPAVPGLNDVCAHFLASEPKCSPEICNITSGAHVELEPRTYYQDRAVVLPTGAKLIGAGINKTIIVNCGKPSTEMRGFILGNNTYIGNFTWQGHSPSRGAFNGVVQTPGCADTGDCNPARCIPSHGDCAGVANVIIEHIHVRPYDNGSKWWPLVNDAAWFPRSLPWGPDRATGSRNITIRGLISWGTWADGINFHGGHQGVLVEDCEISYTGDDPYGLWPDSVQATKDRANCQRNIVLRNNIGRWPRQARGSITAGHHGPRDFPDCADVANRTEGGGNWHNCFATYGGGSGVQFLNNHCEGAQGVVRFLAAYPFTVKNKTIYCGPVAVSGNTYSSMSGQGQGCRTNNSKQPWCEKSPLEFCGGKGPHPTASGDTCGGQAAPDALRAVTLGGQCNASEPLLPPACVSDNNNFAACAKIAGMAGVCYDSEVSDRVRCVSATELAELVEGNVTCEGFSSVCTLMGSGALNAADGLKVVV